MPTISHDSLREYGAAIFAAAGFPADQGQDVTDHLVDSNLVGHDSHGVIRLPGYITAVREGAMKPVGPLKIVRESPASVVIDAQRMQGIVLAKKAMEMAVDRAKQYTFGAVGVHQSTHIGRLGAFQPIAAEQDCIGLLLLNGGGPFTAPFGGTGRRLPPNPLAFSAPRAGGAPLMLDMTTSMVAGGKVKPVAGGGGCDGTGQIVPTGVDRPIRPCRRPRQGEAKETPEDEPQQGGPSVALHFGKPQGHYADLGSTSMRPRISMWSAWQNHWQ